MSAMIPYYKKTQSCLSNKFRSDPLCPITSTSCSPPWRDELYPSLGKDYFLPLQQANDALTALSATLTDQQRALLDSYEDASAAAGSAYQDAYARRAFLLAREVYR